MTRDYSPLAATAARLIKKFGGSAVLVTTTQTGTASDPGASSETETAVSAVILDYSAREREGTSIEIGDRRAYVSAPSGAAIPDLSTLLRFKTPENVDYQIMEVRPIQPAGPGSVAVLFECRVRT